MKMARFVTYNIKQPTQNIMVEIEIGGLFLSLSQQALIFDWIKAVKSWTITQKR